MPEKKTTQSARQRLSAYFKTEEGQRKYERVRAEMLEQIRQCETLHNCPYCESTEVVKTSHGFKCACCGRIFDNDDIERESLRHIISPYLSGTSESRPRKVSIVIDEIGPENAGRSSLSRPEIDMLFEVEGDGTMWYHIYGDNSPADNTPNWKNIDTLSIEDLRTVCDALS